MTLKLLEDDWRKAAATASASGTHSDDDVEKAFLDQAYMFIQNKATPLMKAPYRLGFEIVYKNDANTRMIGIFAFRVGTELLYAPVFFSNGSIKGSDLLYRHGNKRFVPLTSHWSEYLISLSPIKQGAGIGKEQGRKKQKGIDMENLINPPDYSSGGTTKSGSYRILQEANPDQLPIMDDVYQAMERAVIDTIGQQKQAAQIMPGTGTETRSYLKDFLVNDGGYPAVQLLTDAMEGDAKFAMAMMDNIGINNILPDALHKQASEAATKKPDLQLFVGLHPKVASTADALQNGYIYDDSRKVETLVDEVFINEGKEFSGIAGPGIYDLLKTDGTSVECFVGDDSNISLVYGDDGCVPCGHGSHIRSKRVRVIDLENNRYCSKNSDQIIGTKKDQEFADDDRGKELPTVGKLQMMYIPASGTLTDSFYVSKTEPASDGVNSYRIRSCKPYDSEDSSCCDNDKILTINSSASGIDLEARVFETGKVKFINVDNGQSDFALSNSVTLEHLLQKGQFKKAKVEKDGEFYRMRIGSRVSPSLVKGAAVGYLMNEYRFTQEAAEAAIDNKGCYYQAKQATNLSFNKDDNFYTGVNNTFGLPEEDSHQVMSFEADSDKPENPVPRVGDSAQFDNPKNLDTHTPMSLHQMSQQTGDRQLFEHGVVGQLANTYDSRMMIDKYLPDMETGLDRIGRLLFLLYWKPEDFSELYGADDQSELESMFISNFKAFGELVLDLLKKVKGGNSGVSVSLS